MKANKTLMAMLAIGSLLAFSPLVNAADTNAPAAGATPPAGAQGGRGRMMGPNVDQLAKDLSLTDDQKAKLQKILDDRRAKMRALMQDQTVQGEDRRTKMKALQEDMDKQLKDAGFTQDQIDKIDKATAPRQRRNAPPAGGDAAAPAAPADKAQQ